MKKVDNRSPIKFNAVILFNPYKYTMPGLREEGTEREVEEMVVV